MNKCWILHKLDINNDIHFIEVHTNENEATQRHAELIENGNFNDEYFKEKCILISARSVSEGR